MITGDGYKKELGITVAVLILGRRNECNMRNIIFGDIHGCSQELIEMLHRLKPGDEDRLIMLGDLFDRGPDSYGVFETVKRLELKFGERFILLRGNHEDYLLQKKLTLYQRMIWERVGRSATVRSFRVFDSRLEDAIPWIREHCCVFWKCEDFQCVHAGLKVDPIEANDTYTMIHDHEVIFTNKYSGPLTVTGHIALEHPMWFAGDGETVEELVYNKAMQLPKQGIICIDTGCGKNGFLTAMIIKNGCFRLEKVDVEKRGNYHNWH